jgi:hypothetical protein
MAKTVIALHDDTQAARRSMRELIENGFIADDISFVIPASEESSDSLSGNIFLQNLPASVAALPGLTAQLIKVPGIGRVETGGPLGVELNIQSSQTFSGVGRGLLGGLMGALMSMGVPEERAHYYAEGVRQGSTLVMVKTPDYRALEAVAIINHNQPVDLNKRAGEWRQAGWTGFKASSAL